MILVTRVFNLVVLHLLPFLSLYVYQLYVFPISFFCSRSELG